MLKHGSDSRMSLQGEVMTENEAVRVLATMSTADGECSYCAGKMFRRFIKDFPEHEDTAKEVFKTIFDTELSEEDE